MESLAGAAHLQNDNADLLKRAHQKRNRMWTERSRSISFFVRLQSVTTWLSIGPRSFSLWHDEDFVVSDITTPRNGMTMNTR